MIRKNQDKDQNEICIIEIFKSLNGEGWAAGLPTVFVRTMGCNLRCKFGATLNEKNSDSILNEYCDTPECFSEKHFKELYPERELEWYTAQEIFDKVEEMEKDFKYKSICLTGGEPLIAENKDFMLSELLPLFIEANYDVSIETNGAIDYKDYKVFGKATVYPDGHRTGLTIIADYKLPSSLMTSLMLESNLGLYDETDLIKMVVSDDPRDWEEIEKIIKSKTKAAIYISPAFGKVDTEKMWHFAEKYASRPVRVQLQLHKYFFKNPNQKSV